MFVISEELSSSVLSKSTGTWSDGSESSPELSVSLSSVIFVLDEIPVSGSVVSWKEISSAETMEKLPAVRAAASNRARQDLDGGFLMCIISTPVLCICALNNIFFLFYHIMQAARKGVCYGIKNTPKDKASGAEYVIKFIKFKRWPKDD